MKQVINNYIQATEELIQEFCNIYFKDEDDIVDYRNIWDYKYWAWMININTDYFFDIDDIFVATKEDIPKDVLFDWYDYQLEHYTENKEWNPTNLINYCKLNNSKTLH